MTVETVTSENLAEFNASKLGLNTEEPKTPVAEVVEPETKVETEEVKTEGEDPPPKKPVSKLESRFAELTEQRRAIERERDEARRERDELKSKLEPKKEAEAAADEYGPKPDPKDYQDAFLYAEDLSQWSANKALKDRDKQEIEQTENARREKVVEGWKSRVQAARLKYADFDDMLASSKAAVCDPARDSIIESEYGPDITYALSEDDALAERVTKMKPADQVKWVGKMEDKFERMAESAKESKEEKPAVEEKERVKPPAPIVPVRGSKGADNPVTEPGEFKGTFAEWKALRKKMA